MTACGEVERYGIKSACVHHNLSPAHLYEAATRIGTAEISSTGALVARSGERTGRSPKDKRIVDTPGVHDEVWWDPKVNIPITEEVFQLNRARATDYLSTLPELFVMDVYAGWDPKHRLRIRVISYSAFHALFVRCMFIQPDAIGLGDVSQEFSDPDVLVLDAGKATADVHTPGMTSDASIDLKLPEGSGKRGEIVVLGTEYAGEIKKAVFSVMHWLLPPHHVLSMHCSASAGARDPNDVSLFFGLSGTGKTTLSADPQRKLIGDDEHGWGKDTGTFCFEAGNFAKVIDLDPAKEPDIFSAVNRFGAVVENVPLDPVTRECRFSDRSITENTRAAYPITHITSSLVPCVAGQPRNIIFLTCDAFGVLPLVSRLSPEAANYHFLSGYTSKLAGTEIGIIEPVAVFSAAFGAPFLVRPPEVYSQLFYELLCGSKDSTCWLVSTGWVGGAYGAEGASRAPLRTTRKILDAIHQQLLDPGDDSLWTQDPGGFNLWIPTVVPGVDSAMLNPREAWVDKEAYDATALKLAKLFKDNFEKNYPESPIKIRAAGPL